MWSIQYVTPGGVATHMLRSTALKYGESTKDHIKGNQLSPSQQRQLPIALYLGVRLNACLSSSGWDFCLSRAWTSLIRVTTTAVSFYVQLPWCAQKTLFPCSHPSSSASTLFPCPFPPWLSLSLGSKGSVEIAHSVLSIHFSEFLRKVLV